MPPQTPRVRRIRNRQPGSSGALEKSIHSVTVRSAVAAGHLAFAASGVRPDRGRPGPGQALRGFLDALGVPATRIPEDLATRTGLFRSLLAGQAGPGGAG